MQASPPTWRLRTTVLAGRHVVLEPLDESHVGGIEQASRHGRDTFGYTLVPDGIAEAQRYVGLLLRDADAGVVAPFVQRRANDGSIVGCTRFLDPQWRLGRVEPDEVEIGGTWLSGPAQRTAINTDAKLLLLTYAFEIWGAQRVPIATDERNQRSRAAIERLGATFEGVLRRHRIAYDNPEVLRNTAVYSIVEPEWPAIKARLTAIVDD